MEFITYKYLPIRTATDEIINFIKERYLINIEFCDDIHNKIEDIFDYLKNDLNVFIEYPYVDKVYRDSYYYYFSTKYKSYPRDCIRLSFFDNSIKKAEFSKSANVQSIQSGYLGYCIIRPTFPDIIGRNLLNKKALKSNRFITCIHRENTLINGVKLNIEGFPHSSQDQESITCAETTIWALMEYFGHKYAEYKPVLPSTIINKLNEHSDRRMLPSSGLTIEQISYALKDFGFGTLIYTKEDDKADFLPDLSVYIESGFPVIISMENNEFAHALLIIGREKIDRNKLISALQKKNQKLIPFTSLIREYIAQDDNLPPYSKIPLSNPGINYGRQSSFYQCRINAFVVPLYKKMYMEVQKARKVFAEIFNDAKYGIRTNKKHIFRMYMASSRSFKEHIGKQDQLDPILKNVLLSVSMPRFIWCGEFIDYEDAKKGMVSSLIVLDATEASENWVDSFIFAAHKNKSLFYCVIDNKFQLVTLNESFTGFNMYDRNLN